MLFINDGLKFKALYDPYSKPNENDLLFCFDGNKIGLSNENTVPIILNVIQNLPEINLHCFGSINNCKCFLWHTNYNEVKLNFTEVKSSCLLLPQEFQHATIIGNYITHWRNINQYCGKCGATMNDSTKERARTCSACNNIVYPRISPCIIVLVTNGEKILLARSPHFPPGILSTLAGFIDIGETVEQAIIREVKEEVGIEVDDLKYICSQPWLFPDSLMLGFTAKYVSGDLNINKDEIEFAGWFDKDNLPKLPDTMSIGRHLIDQHLKQRY